MKKKRILSLILMASMVFMQTNPVYAESEIFVDGDTSEAVFEDDTSGKEESEAPLGPSIEEEEQNSPQDSLIKEDQTEDFVDFSDLNNESQFSAEKNIVSWTWHLEEGEGEIPIITYNDSIGWQLSLSEKDGGYSFEEIKNILPSSIDAVLESEDEVQTVTIADWDLKECEMQVLGCGSYVCQAELEAGYVAEGVAITVFIEGMETEPETMEQAEDSVSVIESYANTSFGTATSILTNRLYSDNLISSSDVNYYKFSLSSAGYVSFSFTHDYVYSGRTYWELRLYNSNNTEMMSRGYAGNTTATSTSTKVGLPAGTYYIKITDDYYSDVPYKLKVNYTNSSGWEREFNDSFSTADAISVNSAVNGSMMCSDDVDYYKIEIPSYGAYQYTFSHGYVNSGSRYWKVYLYNSYHEEVASYSYVGNTVSETEAGEYLQKGTYYIKVCSSYNYSDVDYSFKLSPHMHSYTETITKATISSNGKIERKCACGASGPTTTIYRATYYRLSDNKLIYNGKKQTPTIKFYGSNGSLISSAYYKVSYSSSRKNVGTYKVRVSFCGRYSGSFTTSFTIVPKGTNISKLYAKSKGFTVKIRKQAKQTTGYQVQYSTSSKFSKASTKTITRNSTTSATYKGLKGKKKYYVRVRTYKSVSGKKYYSSWSAVKAVKTKK